MAITKVNPNVIQAKIIVFTTIGLSEPHHVKNSSYFMSIKRYFAAPISSIFPLPQGRRDSKCIYDLD
jgi:hypothetical protein